MGWFQKLTTKLFGRGDEGDYDEEWDDEESSHQVDFHNKEQRDDYVRNCLEQMGDATKELENLTFEYDMVLPT